ncbi:hypothetical protein OAO87_00955 [bacterium]|nr:hypothetical protein [bacterium]
MATLDQLESVKKWLLDADACPMTAARARHSAVVTLRYGGAAGDVTHFSVHHLPPRRSRCALVGSW